MPKKILVTGGCGFIGSHTCIALLESGFDLVIIDSNVNSSQAIIDKIREIVLLKDNKIDRLSFYKGDIRNHDFLNNIFFRENSDDSRIDAVIHFAGLKSVAESCVDPLSYWENNLLGTINLLKIMIKHNCRKLVFSSSATIYEYSGDKPLPESSIINPINPYGSTKACIEKFLKDIYGFDQNPWSIISLRYFNPIGAHPSGLIGEDPIGRPNNIFPLINLVASKKIKELNIFGNDWNTFDGTCIRDYIHVMDLAQGHIEALKKVNESEKLMFCLNLGTGKGTSVLELVNTFSRVNEVSIPFSFQDRRKGDLAFIVSDNALARKILKWRPTKNIEDMCKDGWNWQKKKAKLG